MIINSFYNEGSSQNFVGGIKDAHMTIPDEQV